MGVTRIGRSSNSSGIGDALSAGGVLLNSYGAKKKRKKEAEAAAAAKKAKAGG